MSTSTKEWVAVGVAIAVIIIFFGVKMIPKEATPQQENNLTTNMNQNSQNSTSTDGLIIKDQVIGSGAEAKAGNLVSVQYTGKFADGKVFDSSVPRGQPIDFVLGSGMVIKGWEQGILGMKVGGKRSLVIPPDLAYGATGYPPVIPPNATLYFDVELVDVRAQ